jgi:hypothetical protein
VATAGGYREEYKGGERAKKRERKYIFLSLLVLLPFYIDLAPLPV